MKKSLLLAFVLITIGAQAQITITQSSFPAVGSTWVQKSDNRLGVHTITAPSSSAQTWNYSNAFVVDDTLITSYIAASSTPYSSSFPQASLAIADTAGNAYIYFKGNSTGFYIDGMYDGSGSLPDSIIDYNPDQLLMPTPFTYGNSRINHARIEYIMTGPPDMKFVMTFINNFDCDAFGTLSTPSVTNQQVIRIKHLLYTVDTTYIDATGTGTFTYLSSNPPSDSSITYTFASNSFFSIPMTISADGGAPTVSTSASYLFAVLNSIPENGQNAVKQKPYPNPVFNGILNFRFEKPGASLLKITDLAGKQVYSTVVTDLSSLTVNFGSLASGAYLYQVFKADGSIYDTGKIINSSVR
ncbi:MAG: T9SS type A sorting domain-containing protein [Bacteroidia bacterium]|nr:T9SS type A sorting domain-containing protein [Bacteroidia bacterium]MCZ2277585.1 T9SS type A sorting domain-containing protein [Bacteroidia bacterium]